MENTTSLTNHFLIAMPCLNNSAFSNTITYICDHSEEGAMGIVINHPLQLQLDEVFNHLNIDNITGKHRDYIVAGGPVQTERGFVLHECNTQQTGRAPKKFRQKFASPPRKIF